MAATVPALMAAALAAVDTWFHVCRFLTLGEAWVLLHVSVAARGGFLAHAHNRDVNEWVIKLHTAALYTGCAPHLLALHSHVAADMCLEVPRAFLADRDHLFFADAFYVHTIRPDIHFPEIMCNGSLPDNISLLVVATPLSDRNLAILTGLFARCVFPNRRASAITRMLLNEGALLVRSIDVNKRNKAAWTAYGGTALKNCEISSASCSALLFTYMFAEIEHARLNQYGRDVPRSLIAHLCQLAII